MPAGESSTHILIIILLNIHNQHAHCQVHILKAKAIPRNRRITLKTSPDVKKIFAKEFYSIF
jgi:hypothetical protein